MTDELRDAFRAVRDRYDGEHPQSDATLRRALLKTRALDRKRRVTRWVVLPMAAALCASTAWAGMTGRLPKAISSLLETEHPAAPTPSPPVNVPVPVPVHGTPVNDPIPAEPSPEPMPAPTAATPPSPIASPSTSTSTSTSKPAIAIKPSASANDPHADLFASAHRIRL